MACDCGHRSMFIITSQQAGSGDPGPEIGEVIILKHFDLSLYDPLLPARSILLKVSEFFPNSAKVWGPSVQTHAFVEDVS